MSFSEQTARRLRELRLSTFASAYELQQTQPTTVRMGFDERLSLLVESEVSARDNRRLERIIKAASLPERAHIEDLEQRSTRQIDHSYIETLAGCEWIRQQQALIVVGATGVGKTWLACALAMQACRMGITCLFYSMRQLLEDIATNGDSGSLPKFKKELAKPTLLIIDDFGLGTIDAAASSTMLEVVDRRIRTGGALMVTSQFPVEKWHSLLPDPSVADALLDRIVHSAHKIVLKGESMRRLRSKSK